MNFDEESKPFPWTTLAALSLLIIAGAYLRLFALSSRSISHVEMYVPGIRMPRDISVPGERLTLPKVLTGTFSSDTHPPGYYVFMWAWTKCFGTGVWSLRLPSVIFGTACIPLVFWLGTLVGQRAAGWIAAILLTVNSHHIFWSDVARMFTLTCFLGLAATILLLLFAQDARSSRLLGYLYVLVILLGLSSHIFFWSLLGTHVLWTWFNAWNRRQPFPAVGELQIFATILGSPLLAFAAYQNGNELATLSNRALIYGREFLQFSFLFPLVGFSSGVYPRQSHVVLTDDSHLSILRWSFVLLSLLLFLAAVMSFGESKAKLLTHTRGVSARAWALASVLATMAILFFVFMAKAFLKPTPNPTLRTTELMAVLPILIATVAITLRGTWNRSLGRHSTVILSRFVNGELALVLALVIVPFTLLTILSLFKPTFNARGMLLLGPYLLLTLAIGIVRAGRNPIVAVALLLTIGAAHYVGARQYDRMSTGRADYEAVAKVLATRIDKTDLIFIRPSWYATPIFYYLTDDWDRFVGQNYESACRDNPHARVWILVFHNYEEDISKPVRDALSNYTFVRSIEAPGVRALLYSPQPIKPDSR